MSMSSSPYVELTRKLQRRMRDEPEFPAAPAPEATTLSTSRYVSLERFEAEQRAIFSRVPLLLFHESELAEAGACLTADVGGAPLLFTRGDDGVVRAFKNACRHRGTRLLDAPAPCKKKLLVCPYHSWTYDLRGKRTHAPHAEAFGGLERARDALVEARIETRHGFVWLVPSSSVAEHLGDIDADLGALGFSDARFYRRATHDVRGNWKLIVDAFLDGYHIKHLHKDTVYRFFIDGAAEAERVGRHIRAVTARRALRDVADDQISSEKLRQFVTPSHVVFPNVVLVFHPDYTSVLRLEPLAADLTRFHHTMLVPEPPKTPAEEEHWSKSFDLVHGGVFVREDLAIVEAMQKGIAAGADDALLFGDLEKAAVWFHRTVDDALAACSHH
jgi:phenylpropionate dioxygenase-like ring-hydroxylating dioxygenase large terminal subunit